MWLSSMMHVQFQSGPLKYGIIIMRDASKGY